MINMVQISISSVSDERRVQLDIPLKGVSLVGSVLDALRCYGCSEYEIETAIRRYIDHNNYDEVVE